MMQLIFATAAFLAIDNCYLVAMPHRTARNSLAELPSFNIIAPDGLGTYSFGYEIDDPSTSNAQFRTEERLLNGDVRGSYGTLNTIDGTFTQTKYVADKNGYRSHVEIRHITDYRLSERKINKRLTSSSTNAEMLFANPQINKITNIKVGDEVEHTDLTAAFPVNSKLSTFFLTPEYLELFIE